MRGEGTRSISLPGNVKNSALMKMAAVKPSKSMEMVLCRKKQGRRPRSEVSLHVYCLQMHLLACASHHKFSPQILTAADRWKALNASSSDKSSLTNMESGSDIEACNRNDGRDEEENNSGEMRDAKW